MRQAALSIAMATVLLASAGLESKAQGTGNAEAKQAQTTQPPTGTVELAQDPSPRGSIIITLLSKLKEFINLSFPRPGAKMPRADVGQFSHFPRVDVASFGLTCSPADLVGHWERDPSDLLGYTGQSERSWIEVTPTRIALFVDVQSSPDALTALEDIAAGMDLPGQDRKPSRRPPRGPFEVVAFDYSLKSVDHCAWQVSFMEEVPNREGIVKTAQTCTVAAEYASLGTGTISDLDDFLWERLNFHDCFPRAETIRATLDKHELQLNQGLGADKLNFAHWLQHWKRTREASWWKPLAAAEANPTSK